MSNMQNMRNMHDNIIISLICIICKSASQTSSSPPNFSSAPADEYSNHSDIFQQYFFSSKL